MADQNSVSDGGVYLYCFTSAGSIPEINLTGPDGKTDIEELRADGLAAIYSGVDLADFQEQMAMQTPDWLIPLACSHEKVVEAVMISGPVLPIRFGAVFSTAAALEDFLVRNASEIGRFLDKMTGMGEWAVKGYLDLGRVEELLLVEDPGFAEQGRRLADTPGKRYFQEKKLRAEVQRRARAWGGHLAGEIQAELQTHAFDSSPLKIQSQQSVGEQVLNCVFLLERDAVPIFQRKIIQLREAHATRGVSLECSGPWPPYHFCPALEAGTVSQP